MRWIFFDCFNTLVDEEDALTGESGMAPIAHVPVAAGLFAHPDEFMAAYFHWRAGAWAGQQHYPEIPLPERLRTVLAPRCSAVVLDPLVTDMVAAFKARYPDTLSLAPGVLPMLTRLRPHYGLAVVSNFFLPGMVDQVLAQFGIDGFFDVVVNSADVGFKKPDPRIYAHALSLAGCAARDACFVGDNWANDVRAPRACGMGAIHLDRRSAAAADQRVGNGSIAAWDAFEPVFS